MKRMMSVVLLLLSLYAIVQASDKIEPTELCKFCGMERLKYDYSRMVVTYDDGKGSATCSIDCTARDLRSNKYKTAKTIQVADSISKQLIDAKTAIWVIGGSEHAVMASPSKLAFANKMDADTYIKKGGGTLATFTDVLKFTEKEQNEALQKEKSKMLMGLGLE